MFQEMIRAQNNLSITAGRTKEKINSKMRATVKDLLGYRYALEGEPIEKYREREELMWHLEAADLFSDVIFGVDSSKKRQFMKDNLDWSRTRPLRIYNYVQKLADIFPPEHLNILLRISLNHTPEDTIRIFEEITGEAERGDYSGEPTGIDTTKFKGAVRAGLSRN
jgi:hypothetical protein